MIKCLAHVFHDPAMTAAPGALIPGGWIIQCVYCGFQAKSTHMEDAGAEFFQHMFFGGDTSKEHLEYSQSGAMQSPNRRSE